ncbi:MAG: tRNA pseudouridine(38-40) synthase TruA [Aerococcus sp.]|nr:tRNA pseudouridine(38-40) synthase TruA [Aerococcus sp.]
MVEKQTTSQRYRVLIEYDGTPYAGFQIQPNEPTVQGAIERALELMTKGVPVSIAGSGRTDSGVHATGQVIHFDYPSAMNPTAMVRALNSILPGSVRARQAEKVSSDFHARYDTKSKRYRYRVNLGQVQSPFERDFVLHHPYRTDVSRMEAALPVLLGTHDFVSFCSTKTDKTDFTRTLTTARIEHVPNSSEIQFVFEGDGFLYNMVRILVGTSLQIGDRLRPVEEFERLLRVKDRNEAGPTAPAHGLYLEQVTYLTPEERQQKTQQWLDAQANTDN